MDIMRHSACLVVNPITVYSYALLVNCMVVGRSSDSIIAFTNVLIIWLIPGANLWQANRGST